MNNTVMFETLGTKLETVTVTLSISDVKNLYEANKAYVKQVEDLKAKLERSESNYNYSRGSLDTAQQEISEANTLLTALGVKENNEAEESWNRKNFKLTTRIALYIAASK